MNVKTKLIFSHFSIAFLVLLSTFIAAFTLVEIKSTLSRVVDEEMPLINNMEILATQANKITAAAPMLIASETNESYIPIIKWIQGEIGLLKKILEQDNMSAVSRQDIEALKNLFLQFESVIVSMDHFIQQKLALEAQMKEKYLKLEEAFQAFEEFINPTIALQQFHMRESLRKKTNYTDEFTGRFEATIDLYDIRKIGYALNDELLFIELIDDVKRLQNRQIAIIAYLSDLDDFYPMLSDDLKESYSHLLDMFKKLSLGSESLNSLQQQRLTLRENVLQLHQSSRILADEMTSLTNVLMQQSGERARRSTNMAIDLQKDYFTLLIVLSFFSLLMAIFLGWVLVGKRIIRPVDALASVAERIKNGDLSTRVELVADDEIGKTAKTFNDMLDELSRHRNHLEALVEERTHELEESLQKLQETQAILIQQSKMAAMGEMMSNIAHQWRQPITSIGVIIMNLKDSFDYGELSTKELEEKTETINRLLQQISVTIDDFRDFFAPDHEKTDFKVSEALSNALEVIQAAMENARIEMEVKVEEDTVIHGFSSEYSQVVLNILSNAKDALIKSHKDKQWIHITVGRTEEGRSRLKIEDDGTGISGDIIEHIFDPYFTTKFKSEGTGMGLYMSKMMIEKNMGGKIVAENTAQGACFSIIV